MVRLMREVRFFHSATPGNSDHFDTNHWAGTGDVSSPPFWILRVVVEGPVALRTGYVCDIKVLDDLVRQIVLPNLGSGRTQQTFASASKAALASFALLAARLDGPLRLLSIQLRFSPHTFLCVSNGAPPMTTLTQSFEFSASHRLHCPGLSNEENHRLFGKCSNPHGHGHNYILEVTAEASPESTSSTLRDLDRIVRAEVIDRFDHKNLNVECEEFAKLNPTVENIAQVIFDRLALSPGSMGICSVRVWETAKTYAECSTASGEPSRQDGR